MQTLMRQIGRYEILEELGRGVMGTVYKARDSQIGRIVAIKVILTANLEPEELEKYRHRFQREAQAAGRMSHPGIVTVYDFAEDENGHPYLVMEYVDGQPLDKLLAPGSERPTLERILSIGIQVAQALDYAHRSGVVHRDIKPANILVTHDGRAKIADFGVAKLAGTQLTQDGQLVGTPAYMSPEQFRGASVDARSDIFSLGGVLYWMCTAEKPFTGDTFTTVSFKIVYASPVSARQLNPALPPALDRVLSRCLAKNPDDRYPTAAQLAADLEAIRSGGRGSAIETGNLWASVHSWVRHRPGAAALLLLVVALLGADYWLWVKYRNQQRVSQSTVSLQKPAVPSANSTSPASSVAPAALTPATAPAQAPLPLAEPTASGRPSTRAKRERSRQPAALSMLHVTCTHNIRAGKLEIFSDGKWLLEEPLHGEDQGFVFMSVVKGKTETSAPLPAGKHALRVKISSSLDHYKEEGIIRGSFPEGGSRTLLVTLGKGSSVPGLNRRLTLSWR